MNIDTYMARMEEGASASVVIAELMKVIERPDPCATLAEIDRKCALKWAREWFDRRAERLGKTKGA